MRHILALIIALTIFIGAGTAHAQNEGKAIGTLAGATIGSLTFKNKVSGAAIGAGVGLLVGAIVDSEVDRYNTREVRNYRRAPKKTVTVIDERPADTVVIIKERAPKRVVKKHRKRHNRHYRDDYRRPIREKVVTTYLPNGRTKVVSTAIYR